MHVNFYATLRAPAGGKTVDVGAEAPNTARSALKAITATRPDLAGEIWTETGELKDHIHVFINGRQSIFLPQGLDTPVGADDTVDVFPPVGGG